MRTGRRSNNEGFSLVELIIVIAIMAILVGVMAISASSLTGRKVKKCADEIVSTIERTRVLTLGKEQNDVECVLTYEGKEYHAKIYQKGTLVSDRIVGKDPIDIKVYFEDGASATGYTLAEIDGKTPYATPGEKGLHLVFNRASGAFEQNTNEAGGHEKEYCRRIVVTNGSRMIEITTVGRTGKILTK